jgi:hypothetical protein
MSKYYYLNLYFRFPEVFYTEKAQSSVLYSLDVDAQFHVYITTRKGENLSIAHPDILCSL